MRAGHFGWLLVATLAGCGGAPLPADRLASAEAGIRGASEVGAQSVPEAALHLKMARDQVAQAKTLSREGDADRAATVLARAEADAELALALTRETAGRAEADAVLAQVQALRRAP
jgi:Domain of unknown function (DUF4398)